MIPISDPGRAISQFRDEIASALGRVLDSGRLILGPENEALSVELSEYLGVDYSILVGNGTDALEIALLAAGVKPGATVLTVANAGGYASTAIQKIGARPVYVDIDASDLQIAVNGPNGLIDVMQSLAEQPAAIVVTHLYGKAAPIAEIMKLVSGTGIVVVEDCAQSLGGVIDGRRLGSFANVSTTSFYPTKNLGALGDGGAIFTSDEEISQKAQALRQYGWVRRYESNFAQGRNSRLDEMQAAVLRLRLSNLDYLNARRQAIHDRYTAIQSMRLLFPHSSHEDFVAHLATVLVPERSRVRQHFENHNIATDIHYPIPDYLQMGFHQEELPQLSVTETVAQTILTIPLFPEMAEDEIERVEYALEQLEMEG